MINKMFWITTLLILLCQFWVAPAYAQSEIGENDFRISFFENALGPAVANNSPAVAYNSIDNEFLVVWSAVQPRSPEDCPLVPILFIREIWGQRIDGTTGALTGDAVRISVSCDDLRRARKPSVAYNAIENEYLVAWYGDDDDILSLGENEIFGQLLSNSLAPFGVNDFRISDMGGTGDTGFDAFSPAVTHNPVDNEYLVVWYGDDNVGGLIGGELEIFGQRLDENGTAQGNNDFRISDMGGTGDSSFQASRPSVTYNSVKNEYLVVWEGDDNVDGLSGQEFEIFGQRLDENGTAQGDNDFRISDMGGTGDSSFWALSPKVAYNAVANEYLVVWEGDDNVGGLSNDEFEIFGQRLDEKGAEQGNNDFRISDMGGTGEPLFEAQYPEVAYNAAANEYFVVWEGDDNVGGLSNDEFEIFGQRLDEKGAEPGENDFRISDMGGTGDNPFGAYIPAVANNPAQDEVLVVWRGDDNVGGLGDDEFEIFGQRLKLPLFGDGFESGSTSAWSAAVP
jgi:hypothetical protein